MISIAVEASDCCKFSYSSEQFTLAWKHSGHESSGDSIRGVAAQEFFEMKEIEQLK